jgi:DNA primase small subunit
VFDIDADHLNTHCKPIHDKWVCEKCGDIGKWPTPKKCPKCSAISFKEETWICELCLNKAKEETLKLYDMLTEDLGFRSREISIYFTGHRGYHVHVRNENIKTLGSDERREIVDYIAGIGLDLDLINMETPASDVFSGWKYRLERELGRLLFYATEYELTNLGMKGKILKDLYNFRERAKGNILKNSVFRIINLRFKNLLNEAIKECSAHVDAVVTTDIHRLVRLPGTLNSKTGLKVVEVKNLQNFDPLKESLSLIGYEETVYISKAPKFRIGDSEYGPYRNEKRKLPIEAALMLICKGRAHSSND